MAISINNIFKKKEVEDDYYDLEPLLKVGEEVGGFSYAMIIGLRSNGKTYQILLRILKNYIKSKGRELGCYIRRYDEDISSQGMRLFNAHSKLVSRLTRGEWDHIKYYQSSWWLARYETKEVKHRDGTVEEVQKEVRDEGPFCISASIHGMEGDKGSTYSIEGVKEITTTLLDEFISRTYYLPNEVADYFNVLSTIIRTRTNCINFLCANTVSIYCPYFENFGIDKNRLEGMTPGEIDCYTYQADENDSDPMRVLVELVPITTKTQATNKKYFAFNNPRLSVMKGCWETGDYPIKPPVKYEKKDIIYTYFIEWAGNTYAADIVQIDGLRPWQYIHKHTSGINDNNTNIVVSDNRSFKANYINNLYTSKLPVATKILELFINKDLTYYQSLYIGEECFNMLRKAKEER